MSSSQAWAQPHGCLVGGHKGYGLFFLSDSFDYCSTFHCNIKHVWVMVQEYAHKNTHMLTSLTDRAYGSGYSAMTGWERVVERGRDWREYITTRKKNIPALPAIPTYCETVMLSAVTLLSSPFLSVCIQQQLLWTTLKRGIRSLIQTSPHKPGTYISKTMVPKAKSFGSAYKILGTLGTIWRLSRYKRKTGELSALPEALFWLLPKGCISADITVWPAAALGTHSPPIQRVDACSKRFIVFLFSL